MQMGWSGPRYHLESRYRVKLRNNKESASSIYLNTALPVSCCSPAEYTEQMADLDSM